MRVAYIDDEVDLCEIFKELFTTPEVTIDVFSDYQEAIVEGNKKPYDIVFVDLRLPGITGDEIALRLPKQSKIYLVTGDHSPETHFQFKGVLPKPFDYEAIADILAKLAKEKSS